MPLLTASSPSVLGAVYPQPLLQLLLLEAELHGVHQVIDVVQGPHGRWEPRFYVAVLPHEKHAEIIPADLQLFSQVVDRVARQRFNFALTPTWKKNHGVKTDSH